MDPLMIRQAAVRADHYELVTRVLLGMDVVTATRKGMEWTEITCVTVFQHHSVGRGYPNSADSVTSFPPPYCMTPTEYWSCLKYLRLTTL